jgi:hypothetical protein
MHHAAGWTALLCRVAQAEILCKQVVAEVKFTLVMVMFGTQDCQDGPLTCRTAWILATTAGRAVALALNNHLQYTACILPNALSLT